LFRRDKGKASLPVVGSKLVVCQTDQRAEKTTFVKDQGKLAAGPREKTFVWYLTKSAFFHFGVIWKSGQMLLSRIKKESLSVFTLLNTGFPFRLQFETV